MKLCCVESILGIKKKKISQRISFSSNVSPKLYNASLQHKFDSLIVFYCIFLAPYINQSFHLSKIKMHHIQCSFLNYCALCLNSETLHSLAARMFFKDLRCCIDSYPASCFEYWPREFPDLSNPPRPLLHFVLRQLLTCKQIATFTLQPKVVLTARGERPKSLKIFEKDWVSAMRGLSSATTMHVRTQDRFTFRSWRWKIEVSDQRGHILWKHKHSFMLEDYSGYIFILLY